MPTIESIDELRRRRDELRGELAAIGDFRPGTLVEYKRKCGKPNCHCAQRPRSPRMGADAEVRRQAREPGDTEGRAGGDAGADRGAPPLQGAVAAPGGGERGTVPGAAEGWPGRGAGRPKRGLRSSLTAAFAADIAAEIDALAGSCWRPVRRQALGLAARLVERRLNADRSDRAGATLPCACGARASYAGRRAKTVTTVLGDLRWSAPTTAARAAERASTRATAPSASRASLSPGMTGLAAARASFDRRLPRACRRNRGRRTAPERRRQYLGPPACRCAV